MWSHTVRFIDQVLMSATIKRNLRQKTVELKIKNEYSTCRGVIGSRKSRAARNMLFPRLL